MSTLRVILLLCCFFSHLVLFIKGEDGGDGECSCINTRLPSLTASPKRSSARAAASSTSSSSSSSFSSPTTCSSSREQHDVVTPNNQRSTGNGSGADVTHKKNGRAERSVDGIGSNDDDMVYIEGGRFMMGTDQPIIRMDGEGPARPVRVSSFHLDRYAVTNEQYACFVEATSFKTENEAFGWSFVYEALLTAEILRNITQAVKGAEWWVPVNGVTWRSPEGPQLPDVFHSGRAMHPVVQVTWNDARAYCSWLGKRLPSEAEWEYAASTGGEKQEGAIFPWGDVLQPEENYMANIWQGRFPNFNTGEDGWKGTCPKDAYGPQNAFGLYNLIGNVWEWVEDTWTTRHSQEEQIDPRGPAAGPEKVKKGGSFLCHESYCYRYRTVARHHSTADSATSNNGFRCAK